MCLTCGCDDDATVRSAVVHANPHAHPHAHPRPAAPEPVTERIELDERLLVRNDTEADALRTRMAARGVRLVNLMSSPGSGKTSLLERTVAELDGRRPVCVVEGDQATSADAERIARAGAPAVQVNTGAGCHLDAAMVGRACDQLDPVDGSLVFVENVGNLVCPALFDVGESARVVVMSTTEGDDKPVKYPHMFATADLVLVNKTDLLPYVDCDLAAVAKAARSLRRDVTVLALSVRTGEGLDQWYAWLEELG